MTTPVMIKDVNLSQAWYDTVKYIIDHPGKEVCPLVLSLTDFSEIDKIRDTLDARLSKDGLGSIRTVSETIFPNSLYEFCDYNRHDLYNEYLDNIPRIKKIDSSNRNGTYFERLIAYENNDGTKKNQLDMIIESLLNNNNRRSKLQASIFDPRRDHITQPFQGFPCLQHVTFYKSKGGLVINSFYAIQHLYRRGYGNWLGLINLGKFVANEANLKLERFNCFIGVEKLEKDDDHGLTKVQAKQLLKMMD